MTLDWFTITTIVLGSSFLGAVLTNLAGWAIRRAERFRQANYLGLHLAYVFESFAYTCLSAVEDHDTAESSDGHAGGYIKKIPEFPRLPDFDYRDFDLSILDKVFDFPQQVSFANLLFEFEVLDGEDAVEEGYKSSLKLAQDSLSIADRIRSRYKLTKRALEFGDYSVRQRLKEKATRVKKRQAEK